MENKDDGVRLARIEEQLKTLFEQQKELKKLTESVNAIALSVQSLVMRLEHVGRDVDGLHRDVDEIKTKPTRRWESLVTTLITTAVGALGGAAIALLIN